ncbi:type II toxin-antitoxin system RelE/ParE family toxin [Halomonas campisalis]|uniref:Type II toxin-antitoxin system RelE/ParE family toxin n=1 Tax=Billgrantia campisalis TaxID=74661 RepID=A0ABS9PE38_9GAMM|nr:type II toxin-antitoxin system RelE/ParE family toxin [Halomonas campisalis]MCG6659512.1 type II toxin-antitoxin system RelE/ParE family toxin [Halomonas campisalis]MDR5864449.1 type II toxin-antitoxin system RelE/ParE family toxin [Halomonas campisalis]
MTYQVQWTLKATKQASKIPKPDRSRIIASVGELEDWPGCVTTKDIKPLKRHQHHYRLRVGRYRVLFDVETGLRVVSIEEVKKRDERTY